MTTQDKLIRGKIAKVLSDREVVLNVGHEHGVQAGMFFDIRAASGFEVTDPDTGEVLGKIDRPRVKAQVKVTNVEDKFAIAMTYRTERVNVGVSGALSSLAAVFGTPTPITRVERIRSHERAEYPLSESERYVEIGDSVVQIFDEEAAYVEALETIFEDTANN